MKLSYLSRVFPSILQLVTMQRCSFCHYNTRKNTKSWSIIQFRRSNNVHRSAPSELTPAFIDVKLAVRLHNDGFSKQLIDWRKTCKRHDGDQSLALLWLYTNTWAVTWISCRRRNQTNSWGLWLLFKSVVTSNLDNW